MLDGLERELGAAQGVGGVELVDPVPGDLHLEVAGQRKEGDCVAVRIEPKEHGGVGEPVLAAELLVALVRAQDEDRLSAAVRDVCKLVLHPLPDAVVPERMGDVAEVEDQAGRRGRGDRRDDHEGGGDETEPDREADVPATALKPDVILGPAPFSTFSNPEVMADPARLILAPADATRVFSSAASASAASSPSHSCVSAETTRSSSSSSESSSLPSSSSRSSSSSSRSSSFRSSPSGSSASPRSFSSGSSSSSPDSFRSSSLTSNSWVSSGALTLVALAVAPLLVGAHADIPGKLLTNSSSAWR